jgi:hypothetical protein
MVDIGRIQNISPRDAWRHEAHDFTPWLFQNLQQLGEVVGLTLEPEETEVSVDSFYADILAKDAVGDRLVLIENQLESTDHKHLGQLLTYLAGLEAEIVIWIATEFRDPHLSAINWLNEHTDERFGFFAVQLRVVSIGDSPLAPIFDVRERPNQWNKRMHNVRRNSTEGASKFAPVRREFWEYYLSRFPDDGSLGVKITGSASNWLAAPPEIGVYVSLYRSKDGVGVFLRGPRGMSVAELQQKLEPHADEFVKLVGACNHIGDYSNHPSIRHSVDMDVRENWGEAADWLHDTGSKFLSAAIAVLGSER